jgi:hypothetical protein
MYTVDCIIQPQLRSKTSLHVFRNLSKLTSANESIMPALACALLLVLSQVLCLALERSMSSDYGRAVTEMKTHFDRNAINVSTDDLGTYDCFTTCCKAKSGPCTLSTGWIFSSFYKQSPSIFSCLSICLPA